MTFYTLKYDVLCPTVQQLNIPTNTDYRVGVKVARGVDEVDLGDGSGVTLGGLPSEGLADGYVTFAKSSGDEASLGEDTVSVDLQIEPPIFEENSLTGKVSIVYFPPPTKTYQVSCTLDLSAFAGKSVPVDNFYCAALTATEASAAEAALSSAFELVPGQGLSTRIVNDGGYPIYCQAGQAWDLSVRSMTPEERSQYIVGDLPPEGVKYALRQDSENGPYTPVQNVEVEDGMRGFVVSYGGANSVWALGFRATLEGVKWNASFRLRTNVYKSQEGDVEGFKASRSVKIEGTDASGSAFSFDAITA